MTVGQRSYTKTRLGQCAKDLRRRLSLLKTLDLELTERCNNDCLHCGINLPHDDHAAILQELSTRTVCSIIREAAALGCRFVRITGGEPLLRDDFEEIYRYARQLSMRVLLFSNATLLSEDHIALFATVPPLEPIEITLYGMSARSCAAVTKNPDSFAAAQRGIALLIAGNIPFTLKYAALPANMQEIAIFRDYCRETLPSGTEPALGQFFNLRVRRDSPRKNQVIQRQRVSADTPISFYQRHLDGYLAGLPDFLKLTAGPQGSSLFGCSAGLQRGCVDAYGGFSPCLLLKNPHCTFDLKNGSLADAVYSFFPKIRSMQATDPDYLSRCAKCFLKSLCEQCPAKAWMERGALDKPATYYCQVAHAIARHLGLLETDEMAWQIDNWRERLQACTATNSLAGELSTPRS